MHECQENGRGNREAPQSGDVVVLLGRSAMSAAPMAEMERLRAIVADLCPGKHVAVAFSEQGTPNLHDVLSDVTRRGYARITILPLALQMEPSVRTGLIRTIACWQAGFSTPAPEVRLGPAPGEIEQIMTPMLSELLVLASASAPVESPRVSEGSGSIVVGARRRVLVCQGGPCNEAGAASIWGHLRREQNRLSLRTCADGMMSARTSCLGPCGLAPVVQVWPEGTIYGGLDASGIDRIIEHHILAGAIVEDLAYHPTGKKQKLRSANAVEARPAS